MHVANRAALWCLLLALAGPQKGRVQAGVGSSCSSSIQGASTGREADACALLRSVRKMGGSDSRSPTSRQALGWCGLPHRLHLRGGAPARMPNVRSRMFLCSFCVHVCVWGFVYVCLCVCICEYVRARVCMHVYMCVCMCVCLCLGVSFCVCVSVCVYMYRRTNAVYTQDRNGTHVTSIKCRIRM